MLEIVDCIDNSVEERKLEISDGKDMVHDDDVTEKINDNISSTTNTEMEYSYKVS